MGYPVYEDSTITFKNVVHFGHYDTADKTFKEGALRYDNTLDRFEAKHINADVDGNFFRPLTQNIATTSDYGVFKVGSNLLINESTGYLSSLATASNSRVQQLVITVSPQVGAADYTSIVYAISNVIGTASGGYIDGSLTQASALENPPNSSNSFVVLLSPGRYNETERLVLPDYVSLVGMGHEHSIIEFTANADVSVSDGSAITVGSNSFISGISIELNGNNKTNICGIYSGSDKKNVKIKDVNIKDSGNQSSTSSLYGIYIESGGSEHTIQNVNTTFTLGSSLTYGIYINNTISTIDNTFIKLNTNDNTNTNNYGIYLESSYSSEIPTTINNSLINLSGATNNYGIYYNKSSGIVKYTDVEVDGDNNEGYGIALSADAASATNTSTDISFNHSTTDRDSIITIGGDFISKGFTERQRLKISGASNSNNNGIFTIYDVSTDTITLIKNDTLVNESPGSTVTLQELYSVDLVYNQIGGSSNVIASVDSNSFYSVEASKNRFIGGNVNIINNIINFSYPQIIIVSKQEGDFQTLNGALKNINDASSNKRYTIFIKSGNYIENFPIACKEFVNIIGDGPNNTILTYDNAASTFSQGSGITLSSNMELRGMTIKNITTGTNNTTSIVLYGSTLVNVLLKNLEIHSSGVATTQYGIYMNNVDCRSSDIKMTVEGTSSSSVLNVGWYHTACKTTNESTEIVVTKGVGATATNIGIDGDDSEIELFTPNIHVSGSTFNNGINSSASSGNKSFQIFGGQINGVTNSVISGINVNMVCNGVRLNGDVVDDSIDANQLVCQDCYQIDMGTNSFTPLSIRGEKEQTDLNTLSVGFTAGKLNMTGVDNTFVGVNNGSSMTSGSMNTFMGSSSGNSTTEGDTNTFIGYQSGTLNMTGSRNVALGSNSAMYMTSGIANTMIGSNAGLSMTNGYQNVALGANSAVLSTTGYQNIAIGSNSSYKGNGNKNVVIGTESNYNNLNGNDNTVLGHQSGYYNTGSQSVLVGSKSGYTNTSDSSVMIGFESGMNATSGIENTVIGYQAGKGDVGSTGSLNTILGYQAGLSMTTGMANVLIGDKTGRSITTGKNNVIIGGTSDLVTNDSAGYALTEGINNIAIGIGSGQKMTACENNIMIGSNAGSKITTSGNNILIGKNAGSNLTISSGNNIMVGRNAGGGSSAQGDSIFIGHESGFGESEHNSNESIFIGNRSGYKNTGDKNTYIGFQAGGHPNNVITGENNLCMGPYTGYSLTTGERNILIGGGSSLRSTGRQLNTGSDNTMLGNNAGAFVVSGTNNTFLGTNAGYGITSSDNIAIGSNSGAGKGGTGTGVGNINIGASSGNNQTTGEYNIGIGYEAGLNSTENNYNINIGHKTGYDGTTGSEYNIHLGYQAGYSSSTGDKNIFTGFEAGYNNTTGSTNIFMGTESGKQNTEGTENINIGTGAGYQNKTGVKNILIGEKAGYGSIGTDTSKNIMIGALTGRDSTGSKNIFIGSSDTDTSGIGINTTGEKNIFLGSNVGINNTSGEKNIFIGAGAGEKNTGGYENVNIGLSSGQNNISGMKNINIGSHTGSSITTGDKNIIIGDHAGETTGNNVENNIFLGEQSGENADQNNLIFVGTKAGKENTTGINNIFIGEKAGELNQGSINNIFIGKEAGQATIGKNIDSVQVGNNIFIGTEAGINNTEGTNNIFIGNQSGDNNTTGINNVVLGSNTMDNGSSTVSNVVVIGFEAGRNNQADDSILIGSEAGKAVTTGNQNVMVGRKAGTNTTTGKGNIYFGAETGETNTKGSYNIGIGFQSLNKFDSSDTSENGYNIAIGYKAGSNIGVNSTALGIHSNSYKNTILGYQALSNGDVNINNVIVGSEACKNVDNVRKFANNVFMGSSVGIGANLSVNSVTIGPNAMTQGTGGEFNIVLGQGCGNMLGNDVAYTATTYENMTINQNNVVLDIPYGSGSYYFKRNDSVLIDDGIGNDQFEGIISNVEVEALGSRTRLVFLKGISNAITIGSGAKVFVLMKNDSSNVGIMDFSKGSSNTFMGNDSAINNTTGSKNIAIGEKAFTNNKKGKYNNILGSQAGQNIISDHNTCFGTKAGNAIDTYSIDYNNTDYTFHSANNAITTYNGSVNFETVSFSSVIDIDGTTSNDGRYTISSSNANVLKLTGFPRIREDGVPEFINNESYFVDNTSYNYFNETLTTTAIELGTIRISIATYGGMSNDIEVKGIKFTNNVDYLKFKNCKKIKITNSKFNDGIHLLNINNDDNQIIYSDESYNAFSSSAPVVSFIKQETILSPITLSTHTVNLNVSNLDNPRQVSSSLQHFHPNHVFYNYFKEDRTAFRVDKNEYKNTRSLGTTYSIFVENSSYETHSNFNDIVFSEGKYYGAKLNSVYAFSSTELTTIRPNFFKTTIMLDADSIGTCIISKRDRTITIIQGGLSLFNGPIYTNTSIIISDTTHNNGHYLLESHIMDTNSLDNILKISASTPLVDETPRIITFEQNVMFSIGFSVPLTGMDNLFKENDIVNFNVINRGLEPLYYMNGSYLVDYTNTNQLNLYDSDYLQNMYFSDDKSGEPTINKEYYSVLDKDTSIQYSPMSQFMLFQNKEITTSCNVVVSSESNAYIQSSIDYAFVDFVPPVMIKLTDADSDVNDGYYIIRKNEHPFTVMYIDRTQNFSNTRTEKQVTIKSHSVSTTELSKDLSIMLPGVTYKIFGADKNHLTNVKPVSTLIGTTNGIHRTSVYLDESLPIVDDVESKIKIGLNPQDSTTSVNTDDLFGTVLGVAGYLPNNGRFIHFSYNTISTEIHHSNNVVTMHVPTNAVINTYDFDLMTENTYVEILNADATYNHKLFKLGSSIETFYSNIALHKTYKFSSCTSNIGTFLPSSYIGTSTIRVNQFVFDSSASSTLIIDPYLLNYLGDNSKFLSFSQIGVKHLSTEGSNDYVARHTDNTSLTFEVASLGDWTSSNIAIHFVEDCPHVSQTIKNSSNETSNATAYQYFISLGEPNPSFRTPDIYRKTRGVFNLYPMQTFAVNSNIYGRVNIYSSNNVVQLKDMIIDYSLELGESGLVSFDYNSYATGGTNYYQGLYDTTNFSGLRPGQLITLGGNNGTSLFSIESIEDDDDDTSIKNTKLFLTGVNGSTVTDDGSTIIGAGIAGGISISRKQAIVYDRVKWNSISPNFNNPSTNTIQAILIQDTMVTTTDDIYNSFNFHDIELDSASNSAIDTTTYITNGLIIGDTNHIMMIPTSNLTTSQITNVSFNNVGIRDTFKFYGSNMSIISTSQNMTGFGNNQYIRIEESSNTTINGFYLSAVTEAIDTNDIHKLVLQSTPEWADGATEPTSLTAYVNTNTINSSNVSLTNLSVFRPGQRLIVSGTISNDKTLIVSGDVSTSSQSIYCDIGEPDSSNVVIESPTFCRLISSVLEDESCVLTTGANDIEFHSSNSTIKLGDESTNKLLHLLRPSQNITVSGTTANDGTITVSSSSIPKDSGMVVSSVINNITDAAGVTATLSKNVLIKTIGQPIIATSTANYLANANNFHYQDAEGNNLMLGSFAGQYSGTKSFSIHNVFIGSKVGQTNHGSGNVFLGNETDLATSADTGATTYDNKFAIYKTNFVGVPNNPLIGGDFASGVVGINTIDPVSMFSEFDYTSTINVSISENKTKLVVNGVAIAKSFSSFTGIHKIHLAEGVSFIEPGMIVISTGKVRKDGMVETVVTVNTTNQTKHKAVYGIYSHFEENIVSNGEKEKIFDNNGNVINNPAFTTKKMKTHYSASLGEGCIWVCNVNGNIENGDYITTSNIGGYGMKQDDDFLHNYTVAKCTESVEWGNTGETQYILMGCTYHCG